MARRSSRIINDAKLISNLIAKGAENKRSIYSDAAKSYKEKHKPSDEPALSEYSYDEYENDTVLEDEEENEYLNVFEEENQQQAPKGFENLMQRNCETCS